MLDKHLKSMLTIFWNHNGLQQQSDKILIDNHQLDRYLINTKLTF